MENARGNWVQDALGEVCLPEKPRLSKKNVLQWEESITGVPRDMLEFPITTGFQDATGQSARQSHPGSLFLQKVGRNALLRSLLT